MNPEDEAHFKLLKMLESNPDFTQRELAEALGLSLGKTNYVLHGLVDKGILKMTRFYQSGNKLGKMMYLLTPAGFKLRFDLTQAYIQRKKAEFELLQAELKQLENELKKSTRL